LSEVLLNYNVRLAFLLQPGDSLSARITRE
jgi:hypothetical protein